MKLLLTADLHLNDRPRDAYRFDLFPWLIKQRNKYLVDAILILGDLTDAKDRHSAVLVNKMVDGVSSLVLSDVADSVFVLKGNHDFVDPNNPFFDFLNHIDGVRFITEPTVILNKIAMIPHQPDQVAFDEACGIIKPKMDGVCLHQCLEGAVSETGARLNGISAALVAKKQPGWCYSGDIHKPQHCGCVTYVGAPFHIRFGDSYTPRVVLLDV